MQAYFETGFPVATALTDAFTEEFPNVTWEVREDQFAVITQNAPRVLADDPPDLMRLPQVSELAADGLLLDLDPYAEAFGWDQWPESQLEQLRVDEEGRRGERPAVRDGPQLQHDRRVLQQGARRAGRHDRAPGDARRARRGHAGAPRTRASRRSCSSTAAPPAGSRSRCRTSWPPTATRPRSTTGSTSSRTRPSTPPRTSRPSSTCSAGSRPATSPTTSTPSTTR